MKIFWNIAPTLLAAALLTGCDRQDVRTFQGYIEGEYIYVAPPLGGALTHLAVARGDAVTNGQLLFALERQSEAAALEQAGKNRAQAKATLLLSDQVFKRRQELRATPSGVVSQEELDTARAQRDADAAQVAVQAAALKKAQWAFDQKQQFAPAAAQVHDTLYRQGEYVPAGNPVVVLLPPENVKVRFFVPQAVLPNVQAGESVSVHGDGATKDFSAVVNYISTQAEYTPPVIYSRESRASIVFMIEAKFSPADAANLRPGQPVDVTLP
jgi:HlyD family secretion protein